MIEQDPNYVQTFKRSEHLGAYAKVTILWTHPHRRPAASSHFLHVYTGQRLIVHQNGVPFNPRPHCFDFRVSHEQARIAARDARGSTLLRVPLSPDCPVGR